MAEYVVAAGDKAAHAKVLVANVVDRVVLRRDWKEIEVLSHNGTAAIYFTVDGTEPTVGGAHCDVVPATPSSAIVPRQGSGQTFVKLISAGTPTYSVTGVTT